MKTNQSDQADLLKHFSEKVELRNNIKQKNEKRIRSRRGAGTRTRMGNGSYGENLPQSLLRQCKIYRVKKGEEMRCGAITLRERTNLGKQKKGIERWEQTYYRIFFL